MSLAGPAGPAKPLRALGIAVVAVLCARIDRVQASCPVALEGDPSVVDGVRAELAEFADDGTACLTLWVQCRKATDQLEIDLHDELGRSSLRLFASARGAAAFIVSWSRRPLSLHITVVEPVAVPAPPPRRPPVAAVGARAAVAEDQPWHLELTTGAIVASGNDTFWASTGVAVVQRTGMLRYGGELRMMTDSYLGRLTGEGLVSFGLVTALSDRLTVLTDVVAGGTINGVRTAFGADFGADGLRAGIRAAIDGRLTSSIALEIGGSYEVLRQTDYPFPMDISFIDYLLCPHVEVGLRWVP